MFSVAPNIVFVPNMTQNAERKHRTQDTNTANFRSWIIWEIIHLLRNTIFRRNWIYLIFRAAKLISCVFFRVYHFYQIARVSQRTKYMYTYNTSIVVPMLIFDPLNR